MPQPLDPQFEGFVDSILSEPEDEHAPPRTKSTPIPVVTAPVFVRDGRRMLRMLQAVTAVRCIGSGLLQDLSKLGRDLVGGRAATVEATLTQHLADVQTEIRNHAAARGAGAVVAYHVEIGTYGSGLTILIATGTPVILSEDA